jgi:PAS domain S-box-containing protein
MTPPRQTTADRGGERKGFLPAADPADLPKRSMPLYRFGLGAMLLLAILLVGSLLIDVRTKLDELASSPQDNVQWTLSQFEVEYLAFALSVDQAVTARAAGDPVDLAELRRRYDILYSRTQTLSNSATYKRAFASPELSGDFAEVSGAIYGLAPVIDGTDEDLLAALPSLRSRLSALRERIRVIMTEGNRALVYLADASRREMSEVMFRLALASGFLLVVLLAMVILFRRMAGVSELHLRENLATTSRLEAIFSTSRDGIVVVEEDGRIVGMNRAGLALFQREEADLQGAEIGSVLCRQTDGGPAPLTGSALFDMASSDRQTGIRLTGVRPGGQSFPVELSVDTSVRERNPICVCIIRDISRQAAIETELKQSRDHARAGERAKARFLGVVSHEMRTPLNGILGTLDLVEEDLDTPPQARDDLRDTYLPVMRNSAQAMLTLVNDVLDITQIEGGIRLHPRPFDLDAMLSDLILGEAARARSLGNRIDRTDTPPVGTVLGDADRVRQVLANLLGNAVKFTRNGQITIDATRLDGDMVEVQIADTGIGMSPQDLDRVFDDFVRSDHAVEQQIQGTGLGLGIARSLTEVMHGEIGAESELGEGSLFWVRFPLPPATAVDTASRPLEEAIQHRPARVLLVEDNATNRFIARRLLENDGHHVTEAENGAVGLTAAQEKAFDIILMDISMPVMDGIAATRAIRTGDGPNRATRIVALTAQLSGGIEEYRTEEVMDAVLHKPLDRPALRREIRRATEGWSPPPTTPEEGSPPLSGLDHATTRKLTDRFVAETDRQVARLSSDPALAEDAALIALLHDMAGACASFGAQEMHALLIRAEQAARAADRPAVTRFVKEVTALWPTAREEILARTLAQHPPAGA